MTLNGFLNYKILFIHVNYFKGDLHHEQEDSSKRGICAPLYEASGYAGLI
jgi:hypothetical protein